MEASVPDIPDRFFLPLQILSNRLSNSGIAWAITGSLGWALQSVPVEIHDIDLQTDEQGARRMEGLLSEFSREKLYWRASERIHSYFGVLEISGIMVEIMGGMQKLLPNGEWELPVDVCQFRRWVVYNRLNLPVLALEYEYKAYNLMGRIEKARLLEPYIHKGKIS